MPWFSRTLLVFIIRGILSGHSDHSFIEAAAMGRRWPLLSLCDLVHNHLPQGCQPSLPDLGTKAMGVLLACSGSSRTAWTWLYTFSCKVQLFQKLYYFRTWNLMRCKTLPKFWWVVFSGIVMEKFLVCHTWRGWAL